MRIARLPCDDRAITVIGCRYVVTECALAKGSDPLGVTIENSPNPPSNSPKNPPDSPSGPSLPPRLSRLAAGGVAARSGLLLEGDIVCCVNGVRVWDHFAATERISHAEVPPRYSRDAASRWAQLRAPSTCHRW